jgi:hypothetical protein
MEHQVNALFLFFYETSHNLKVLTLDIQFYKEITSIYSYYMKGTGQAILWPIITGLKP